MRKLEKHDVGKGQSLVPKKTERSRSEAPKSENQAAPASKTGTQATRRKHSSVGVDDSISQQGTLVLASKASASHAPTNPVTVVLSVPARSVSMKSKAPTQGRRRTQTIAAPSQRATSSHVQGATAGIQPDVLKLAHSYRVMHM